jgi:hypothetical protein
VKNRLLFISFLVIFLFLGIMALKDGMPTQKNERVYSLLQNHMPYFLEKRVGGYSIVSKETGIKEKPPAKDLFMRLEQLEKMWGQEFLKLEDNSLVVLDKDKNEVTKLKLETNVEKNWVKNYFELK